MDHIGALESDDVERYTHSIVLTQMHTITYCHDAIRTAVIHVETPITILVVYRLLAVHKYDILPAEQNKCWVARAYRVGNQGEGSSS